MLFNKKMTVVGILVLLVVAGIAAAKPPKGIYKNLKVLPKNISAEDLDKVMDGWKAALGVRCGFCHAPSKTEARKMDYASDEKSEKDIARKMYQMTGRINKKFFDYNAKDTATKAPVTCMTCHHGSAHPESTAPAKK